MHVWTHLKSESEGKTGLGIYPDGMVEHDGHRRRSEAVLYITVRAGGPHAAYLRNSLAQFSTTVIPTSIRP